jgi:hypothetical protein
MKEESEEEKKGRGMLTMILRFLMRSSLNGDSWSMAISASSRTPKSRQAGRGETEGGRARGGFWWEGKGWEDAARLAKQEGKRGGRGLPNGLIWGWERTDPSM